MSVEDEQIIAEFVVESREHLADIENQLLAIEEAGANIDVDLVNEVFRAVHSIKGAAGFLGFSTLGQLSHDLENVLNLIRNREFVPNSAATDVMLKAADTLSGMLGDLEHSNDVDITGHVSALKKIVADDPAEETTQESPKKTAKKTAKKKVAKKTTKKTTKKKTVENIPEPELQTEETVEVEVAQEAETTANAEPAAAETVKPERREAERREPTHVETNIRVSVSVLDKLMNLAGELVLSRNQLLQAVGSNDSANLDSVAARLDQVTSELQESIMQTRMQVIGTVFSKFPRVVRDLSSQLGKQCQLNVEGKDVELDKSIIEAIGDPLTHLVRNSVDHGVESPEVRAKAGKPAVGTIVLKAYHQAGKVNISISDDGAGINAAKLKEKATTKGLITPEQAREMSDGEALRLIFHPGFSLAEKVTGVSGRGVGMDVVKTNIEKLGGAVEIETEIGVGTTIKIKLPLTLAIIPSLVVHCGGNRFAIPQASICELVRVRAKDVATKIQHINDAEVFRLRGNLLPLVRLDTSLGMQRPDQSEAAAAMNIIVVEAGQLQYGLIVDGLHDSEEIVVKPLGRHMKNCPCMAGATILGDGRVALILDVTGIAAHTQLTIPDVDALKENDNAVGDGDDNETQSVLLFTNDPAEQFGVPMALVSRLERVRSDQIDSVGGMEVLQYRGSSLPLLCLEKQIKATPRQQVDKVYIVVFNVLQREVGLIIPELIDICRVSTDVDTVTLREPGVIGSVVVDGKTTRLLDLYELAEATHPEWFQGREGRALRETAKTHDDRVPTILLAEDSGFFLAQVTGFLEGAGYEVVGCEDGLIAWNMLHEPDRNFDLVVTDIEMPNMDGCQLARHIKDDPAFCHLPIIALTSLASEEDMQRGMESGIDDYQIKLDRERLMNSVTKHLKTTKQNTGSPELCSV